MGGKGRRRVTVLSGTESWLSSPLAAAGPWILSRDSYGGSGEFQTLLETLTHRDASFVPVTTLT